MLLFFSSIEQSLDQPLSDHFIQHSQPVGGGWRGRRYLQRKIEISANFEVHHPSLNFFLPWLKEKKKQNKRKSSCNLLSRLPFSPLYKSALDSVHSHRLTSLTGALTSEPPSGRWLKRCPSWLLWLSAAAWPRWTVRDHFWHLKTHKKKIRSHLHIIIIFKGATCWCSTCKLGDLVTLDL